jgi:hypothetical protein
MGGLEELAVAGVVEPGRGGGGSLELLKMAADELTGAREAAELVGRKCCKTNLELSNNLYQMAP